MSANNMQMLLAAALADAGVAYGPTFVFGEYLARGELVALLPSYRLAELTIQAVYPSARHVPFKVRQFIEYLVKAFGDSPPWDSMRSRRK
jgi:DNA-binding transcriptional LysR family regulator